MDSLRLLAVCCCFTSIAIKESYGWSRYTSRLVEVKEPVVIDLLKYVEQDIDYTFSDNEKKLTAIKSQKFKACFVNDLDPYWNPTDDDLQKLANEKSPKSVSAFGTLVGEVISHMCSNMRVYWFADKASQLGLPEMISRKGGSTVQNQIILGNGEPPRFVNGGELIEPIVGTGNEVLIEPIPIDNAGLGLIEPPIINPGNGALIEPPIIRSGNNGDLIEPPVINDGGLGLIEPPIINPGNKALIEPPILNKGNVALIEPPLINKGNVALVQSPITDSGNEALIEPPLINNGNTGDLIEPPMINPDFQDNTGLIEPSRISPSNDAKKPESYLFENGIQSYKRSGGRNTTPSLSSLLKMLRDYENKYATRETMAPPTPDFRTPSFRRIY